MSRWNCYLHALTFTRIEIPQVIHTRRPSSSSSVYSPVGLNTHMNIISVNGRSPEKQSSTSWRPIINQTKANVVLEKHTIQYNIQKTYKQKERNTIYDVVRVRGVWGSRTTITSWTLSTSTRSICSTNTRTKSSTTGYCVRYRFFLALISFLSQLENPVPGRSKFSKIRRTLRYF